MGLTRVNQGWMQHWSINEEVTRVDNIVTRASTEKERKSRFIHTPMGIF